MLRDSVVVVVHARPRAIPLAMITIRKILHGFPFLSHDDYGASLGGPSGQRSSAITRGREDMNFTFEWQELYLTSNRTTRT